MWYKPKCITFIPLYLVFCYLLCVNWVNNVAFHDLGVKYAQRTKIMQKRAKTTLRAKWSFHTKMEDRVSWILMIDQTLKFLWFRDCFERVWDENMQEGHFWIILEKVHFWHFDLWGVFWKLQKIHVFSGECYFWENCSLLLEL